MVEYSKDFEEKKEKKDDKYTKPLDKTLIDFLNYISSDTLYDLEANYSDSYLLITLLFSRLYRAQQKKNIKNKNDSSSK